MANPFNFSSMGFGPLDVSVQILNEGNGSPGLAAKAISWNQKGVEYSSRDDWVNAERWHRKALKAKIDCGMAPVTLGISYNALGESLLELGKLEEAEENLKNAMEIRAALGPFHCFDASVTRENLAQVYQAMGKPNEANQVRVDGEATGEMCCSNYRCPEQVLPLSGLSHCGGCKLPRYCSKACQITDWDKRHKLQCKKLRAVPTKESS